MCAVCAAPSGRGAFYGVPKPTQGFTLGYHMTGFQPLGIGALKRRLGEDFLDGTAVLDEAGDGAEGGEFHLGVVEPELAEDRGV